MDDGNLFNKLEAAIDANMAFVVSLWEPVLSYFKKRCAGRLHNVMQMRAHHIGFFVNTTSGPWRRISPERPGDCELAFYNLFAYCSLRLMSSLTEEDRVRLNLENEKFMSDYAKSIGAEVPAESNP